MIEFSPTSPGPEQRDARTIALLAMANPEGVKRLLDDHGGRIVSMLKREFGTALDDGAIEDALSLAAMRAWNSGVRFDPSRGTLRAWFAVIARNCALRLIEKRRRHLEHSADDLDRRAASPVPTPSSSVDQQRLSDDVHLCIEALPALQRAVMLADLSAGGVAQAVPLAEALGTTPNSIYVSRLKARRALQRALAARGHVIGPRSGGELESRRPRGTQGQDPLESAGEA